VPKVYESSQTRAFKLGRTETIRSATRQSQAFIQAMESPSASAADKIAAARAAFEVHGKLGGAAAQAQGCDRHLLGLLLQAKDQGETPPRLFDQEVWTRGWELSTAQLPMNALLVNSFGPVTAAGYGIGYVIQKNDITATVVSFNAHPDTSSRRMALEIRKTLEEMRALFEQA
ncbi:MAG: choline/carnitine O-acyltransferase, partial [Pseudomonadota bacterium]